MRAGIMSVALRNPLGSPLLLSIVVVILTSFVAASTSLNNTALINGIDDYYDNDYDTTSSPTTKPVHPEAKRCDLCQDDQPSCQQLAAATGCSCPGMSGPHDVPDAPHLRWLSQKGSGSVVVRWCAPASTVTHYLVRVEGQNEELKAGERSRQMDLGKVAAGAEVCVWAVNRVGVSAKGSCTRFESESSESGLALRLGIIGGVVALLVVLALALLIWRLRTRRKTLTRTEAGGAEGVL